MKHTLIYESSNTAIVEFTGKDIIVQKFDETPFLERLSDSFERKWKIQTQRRGGDHLKTDNNELAVFDGGESLIINKNSGQLISKEQKYFFKKDKDVSVSRNLADEDLLQIDHKGKSASIHKVNGKRYFTDDLMIEVPYRSKLIRCYSLKDGKELWSHTLSDLLPSVNTVSLFGEVVSYKDKVHFFLSDIDKLTETFVADIHTGAITYSSKTFTGYLRSSGDKLITTGEYSLNYLDLNTYEEKTIRFDDVLKEKNLQILWNIFAVSAPYLYFSDSRKAVLGMLDITTTELLWTCEFNSEGNANLQIDRVELFDNKVSVTTSDNTAHLYERV